MGLDSPAKAWQGLCGDKIVGSFVAVHGDVHGRQDFGCHSSRAPLWAGRPDWVSHQDCAPHWKE